jgi:hypothetical protein
LPVPGVEPGSLSPLRTCQIIPYGTTTPRCLHFTCRMIRPNINRSRGPVLRRSPKLSYTKFRFSSSNAYWMCKVFMPSLPLFASLLFCVFHVFEVSLLVEVRLRGSLSARSAIHNRVSRESLSLPARPLFSPLLLVFPSTTTKLQSRNVIMSRV